MPRTFICSTGTSAAKLVVDDAGRRLAPGMLREWVTQQESREVGGAARLIAQSFLDIKPDGLALSEKLSAEIHSLVRLNVAAHDRTTS